MSRKSIQNVRGYQISCPNFEGCPTCYGCRAFRPDESQCLICQAEDAKQNLCKVHIHKADLIDRFVTRHQIDLDLQGGFADEPDSDPE